MCCAAMRVPFVGPPRLGQGAFVVWVTSVAPCSPPSRTLRAGYAGADGILDSGCARRCWVRQVGTKEWSQAAEQRNEALLRGDGLSTPLVCLIQGPVGERRAQGGKQAISHATQSTRMAMAALPQGVVASPGGCVALDGDA
jgi:hypothetical protein